MKQFKVVPTIQEFETCKDFADTYGIGKGDLVFVSNGTKNRLFPELDNSGAIVVNYRNYGSGEPTDLMVEGICKDLEGKTYNRVFSIGGGTILDVAKLFALKTVSPVVKLFNKELEIVKDKELILVPTTCGTGSEVTNISILEFTAITSKFGLAVDELYPDKAILIPELLAGLPMKYFATSSIDALIHSIESFTSPKGNDFTRMFSLNAMDMILKGYQEIAKNGEEARKPILRQFMLASTYAGIAFGNAGCAAVHAMSMPFSGTYHVPHGEANYVVFTEVFKVYNRLAPDGKIRILNELLTSIVGGDGSDVYERLETLLSAILPKKTLKEYGVKEEELAVFTENVMTKQGRLTANNYTPLSKEEVYGIYQNLYG